MQSCTSPFAAETALVPVPESGRPLRPSSVTVPPATGAPVPEGPKLEMLVDARKLPEGQDKAAPLLLLLPLGAVELPLLDPLELELLPLLPPTPEEPPELAIPLELPPEPEPPLPPPPPGFFLQLVQPAGVLSPATAACSLDD
jgi:hypothetical protein